MGNGPIHDGNFEHRAGGSFLGFADGVGNFIGLAVANADLSSAVANNDYGGETEVTSAFHDLGHTFGLDHGLDESFFFWQSVFVIQVSSC